MADPFLSEIRIMGFDFAPQGWALTNGQLLPINQQQALFSLLGTQYGGNGQTNFALPDIRGRVPIHVGAGHTLAERGGEQAHTVTISELPTHTHTFNATNTVGTLDNVAGNLAAQPATLQMYGNGALVALNNGASGNTGGSQAHQNMMPYLVLSFCIALQGLFPTQN